MNPLSDLLEGSVISLSILAILVSMSVLAWGIGLGKMLEFMRIQNANRTFVRRIKPLSPSKLKEMGSLSLSSPRSTIRGASIALLTEYQKLIELGRKSEVHFSRNDFVVFLERKAETCVAASGEKLERGMSVLASVSSTAPFIGLLGTVLGITFSFREIGLKGSANLAVVAPGISEALLATALGLFAAIPANLFYNYSLKLVKTNKSSVLAFSQELIDFIAVRTK